VLVLFDLFVTKRALVKSIDDNTEQLEKNTVVLEVKVERLEKRVGRVEDKLEDLD
jgi:chaperonin cofactor prefoldin